MLGVVMDMQCVMCPPRAAIPTGAVGVLVGAVIIFLTKSRGRTVALINWIVTLLSIPPLFIFLVHCPTTLLAGVNIPFADG